MNEIITFIFVICYVYPLRNAEVARDFSHYRHPLTGAKRQ